jgi:transposase
MQQANKPLKRRKYDADFKAEVLKMLANGQIVPYVGQALGISEALIYKWKQRARGDGKQLCLAPTTDLVLENEGLQQRVQQLEVEREILKKALSIFSRGT